MIVEHTDYRILLPNRGISIELPPYVRDHYYQNTQTGELQTDNPFEQVRLRMIRNDSIIAKRYPTPEVGHRYMQGVSPNWREFLLEKAHEATRGIIAACHQLGHERFAVILNGSVARGLVKCPKHIDGSNIDLSVIGETFYSDDRESLLNAIQPIRKSLTQHIKDTATLADCSCQARYHDDPTSIHHFEISATRLQNPTRYIHPELTALVERVTVIPHCASKLANDDYFPVRRYVSASVRPLYDPYQLWEGMEERGVAHAWLSSLKLSRKRHAQETFQTPWGTTVH